MYAAGVNDRTAVLLLKQSETAGMNIYFTDSVVLIFGQNGCAPTVQVAVNSLSTIESLGVVSARVRGGQRRCNRCTCVAVLTAELYWGQLSKRRRAQSLIVIKLIFIVHFLRFRRVVKVKKSFSPFAAAINNNCNSGVS